MHYREQIRKAVITAVTGLTTTATRVKSAPVYNFQDNMSPTLAVWIRSATPDYENGQMQASPLWVIEVIVEGYAKVYTDLMDTLDDMASEVETAIYANTALNALVNSYIECGQQSIEVNTDGNEPVGKIEMVFEMYYHAQEGAPNNKI